MLPDMTLKILSDDSLPSWVTQLIAVGLGGAITLLSTFGVEWRRDRLSSKRLALAVAAEVQTSIRMLRFRNVGGLLRESIEECERGVPTVFHISFGDDYLSVSRGAASTLGSLPGQAPFMLAEFLTLARSAKIDFDDLANPESVAVKGGASALLTRYRELAIILGHAEGIGMQLVEAIDTHYGYKGKRPWDAPVDTVEAAAQ